MDNYYGDENNNYNHHDNVIPAYSDPDSMIYKLQEEVRVLHEELAKAQSMTRGMAHPQLQHWLQLTHEIELKNYLTKKAAAENQLRKAKEECDKLRRKGQSFMGPFRLTHGGSIDDIDTTILKAKYGSVILLLVYITEIIYINILDNLIIFYVAGKHCPK